MCCTETGHQEKLYRNTISIRSKYVAKKVHWDLNVIQTRRPDKIVIDKREGKGIIIDIAVTADVRVGGKEREKVEKYQDLKKEI